MKPTSTLRAFLLGGPVAAILASSAHAATYYWDNNGDTPGFGTAAGTWAAPTTGDSSQGWSVDSTGVTLPAGVTTATADSLNFGYLSTGLAAGSIAVTGTVDAGNLTFASGSGAIVLAGGTLNLAAASTITVNNTTNTVGSVLQGAATSLTKAGTGTVNLTAANTYIGTTALTGGILRLDFNAVGAPQDHIINNAANSSALAAGGGQLTLIGSATVANQQRFNDLTVVGGANTLALNANGTTPKSLLLSLGAITRSGVGSTLNFSLPQGTASASNGITSSTTNTNDILGGWAVVGNNNWAVNNGTNNIGSLNTYTTTTTVAGDYTDKNMDAVGNITVDAAISANSLRFSGASVRTLTLAAGDNVLKSGGILVRSDVGNNLSTITGGNLAGSASGDLIVHQGNTSNGLTIGSLINNNGGATALTKSGAGLITLSSASNSYTGGTFINAGTLAIAADNRLGDAAGGITFGGSGTLSLGGAVTSARVITLNPGVTATVNWTVANNYINSGKVTGAGGISFTQTGGSGGHNFTLSALDNDFTGGVSINNGGSGQAASLTMNSLADSAAPGAFISIGSGAGGNSAGATCTFFYGSGATGALTLDNRRINLIGNGSNTNATGATFSNQNTTYAITVNTDLLVSGANGKLTLSAVAGPTNVFAGKITNSGSTGGVILNKTGAGTWTLSGDNSHSGGTILGNSGGKLNLNSPTALGVGTFSIGAGAFDNTSGSALTLTTNNPQAWNGDFTFTGTHSLDLGTGAVTLGGTRNITMPGAASTLTVGGSIGSSAPGAGIQKTTGAGTLVFNGSNTYLGANTISAGTLRIGHANALGYGGLATTAINGTTASSGTLDLNGATGVNEPLTLSGNGSGATGALVNTNTGAAAGVGSGIAGIKLLTATTGTGYSTAPTITISGTGSGATAAASLGVTTASFTIAVTGDRTYTAAPVVTISGGGGTGATATPVLSGGTTGTVTGITVTAPGSGFSGVPTAVISGGTSTGTTTSTFTGNDTQFTVSGVRMMAAGSGYTGTPTYTFDSGDATPGTTTLSSVTLAANSTIGGAGNTTIAAVVSGGFSLTKVGAGILTLTAANTYTGATNVNGGTLVLGGNNVLPDTAVSIGGATLDAATFSDTAGTLNVTAAGTLNLGTGATLAFADSSGLVTWAGTLNLTGTFVSGSSLRFGTTAAGLTDDQLAQISATGFFAFDLDADGYLTAIGGGSAYDTWKTTNAPTGNPDDDFDGDGVSNAVEFVLGGTAATKDLGKLPTVSTSGGNLLFTFKRAQSSIDPKTSVSVQVGTDLVTWTNSPSPYVVPDGATGVVNPGVTVVKDSPAPGTDTVTLTVPQALDSRKFARLKVVITP